MRTKFAEVVLYAHKSGKCAACGGHARRSRRFWQTLNPWNRTKGGTVKTREVILRELRAEADAWRDDPVLHAKCE